MAALLSPGPGMSQSETHYDLVNAVNALRANQGLEPYRVDTGLMAYAQEHSAYQAAIQAGTHQHSDGSLALDLGLLENVAGGDEGVVTTAVVVNQIWVDAGHRQVLTGYASGEIGAGLALSGNGQVYYTVVVRPGEEIAVAATQPSAPVPSAALGTSTPEADGSITHVVRDGESLWSIAIAYDVSIDNIRLLNGIPLDSTVIRVGQRLLIWVTAPPTPVPTEGLASTASDLVGPPTSTSTATMTAIPSPTSTVTPAGIGLELGGRLSRLQRFVLLAVGIVGALVLAGSVYSRFRADITAYTRK